MKRILLCLLALASLSSLFGCGKRHHFSAEWSKNEKHHWHACTDEGCAEMGDLAEHTWNSGEITVAATPSSPGERRITCTVCGAERFESVAYVPPKTTIGKDEWNAMFSPANATLQIGTMTCRITETLWALTDTAGEEQRFLVKQDDLWREVRYTLEGGYRVAGAQNVDPSYVGFIYRQFDFFGRYSEFTYNQNSKAYVNAEGVRVWVEDGKLMRIEVNGVVGILHSYGTTAVEPLPDGVLNNGR